MSPQFESLLKRLEKLSAEAEELRESFRQSVLIAGTDPEMSLTRARKALEYVVRDVYQSAFAEPPGTRPLENLLQRLVKEERFPKRLAAYANAVRELGNVGTHGFGEGVTARDVYQGLVQFLPILEWYLRQKGPPPAPAGHVRAAVPVPARPAPAPAQPAAPRPKAAVTDPGKDDKGGNDSVCRGGSWHLPPSQCRSAHRFHGDDGVRYNNLGLRVVLCPD
jgi:hypothetical protein